MRTLRNERGMTLVEVSILLVATMAIVAALSPVLSATLRNVETTRAMTDMAAIRDAINNYKTDGNTRFTNNGTQTVSRRMTLLVSDGDTPQIGASTEWREATDGSNYGFLEEHLVFNSFNGGNSYPTASWHGAYLNAPLDPDPWGNRYAVNVQWLGGGSGGSNDVVVLSAGPNEASDSTETADPLVAGGDDLILLVEA